jgi:hypothetical protein
MVICLCVNSSEGGFCSVTMPMHVPAQSHVQWSCTQSPPCSNNSCTGIMAPLRHPISLPPAGAKPGACQARRRSGSIGRNELVFFANWQSQAGRLLARHSTDPKAAGHVAAYLYHLHDTILDKLKLYEAVKKVHGALLIALQCCWCVIQCSNGCACSAL